MQSCGADLILYKQGTRQGLSVPSPFHAVVYLFAASLSLLAFKSLLAKFSLARAPNAENVCSELQHRICNIYIANCNSYFWKMRCLARGVHSHFRGGNGMEFEMSGRQVDPALKINVSCRTELIGGVSGLFCHRGLSGH